MKNGTNSGMDNGIVAEIDQEIVTRNIRSSGVKSVGGASIREIKRLVDNIERDTGKKFVRMEMGIPGLCPPAIAIDADNGKGISGVAPGVKIMPLRFLSEKGQGTTADAIKAIEYAVSNGARVLSNSWGSEGEDPNEGRDNQALREIIKSAGDRGVLFIAAAGNGHQGVGYDNDRDSKPGYPASYDMENIISVAAIDVNDNLGSFSNWGRTSVDIAAPGVKVFSTVPNNGYQDTILDLLGMTVYWDGTSMAAPHVAGAAALYWSKHPEMNYRSVKNAILSSAKKIPSLAGKTVSEGKLNVENILKNF
ncbi:MAG: S8 family serine peptidase [Oligoflexia bacterium]|nr:S8 family serine peptidase [Oligoflexia bacterium]